MVVAILLVLALFVIQTLLPGRFRVPAAPGGESEAKENLGPRDHQRPLTLKGERAARALANMHEAMPVFITLALLCVILAPQASLAVTGAWVFLIARVLYVPIYIAGVSVVRTLLWIVSWVGLILMLVPVLDKA
jgi:uncharacterized MAPEG superfamily protein